MTGHERAHDVADEVADIAPGLNVRSTVGDDGEAFTVEGPKIGRSATKHALQNGYVLATDSQSLKNPDEERVFMFVRIDEI